MSPQRLALVAAARGLVSGSLREWPELVAALRAAGLDVPVTATAVEMRAAAREALARGRAVVYPCA